jgi:ribosome-associated protein
MAVGGVLVEHRGMDVTVLDLAAHSGWTDFFVIATATSSTHLRGLARFAADWAGQESLDARRGSSIADDEEWFILDLGDIVVHIMSERSRAFYELEKLWFQAEALRIPELARPSAKD